MSYHFENLGDDRFQQLSQALLTCEFPRVQCFPLNEPDGGRDAIRRGAGDDASFSVFQVKYTKRPFETNARREFTASAKREADKVKSLRRRGATEYFLITNVPGSGALDAGSIDKLRIELQKLLALPVTIWWRDDLERRLDKSYSVRLRYPELLSGRDALSFLAQAAREEDRSRRSNATTAFISVQYEDDQDVKFKQVELQSRLLDAFIDLPFSISITSADDKTTEALERADLSIKRNGAAGVTALPKPESRREIGTATFMLSTLPSTSCSAVLIEGAPGQGKSTLAQYLCQVHRIRLLDEATDLASLPPLHRSAPLRYPIKVDLRDFSAWLVSKAKTVQASSDNASLETYLAYLIHIKSGGIDFSANDLAEIAKIMPPLVILDGLDEVANMDRRRDVVSAITAAIPRIRRYNQEALVVITSRPTISGSAHGFDTEKVSFLRLGSVSRKQIDEYAKRWISTRKMSDREQRDIKQSLEEKMKQPHVRELAKNPMQLAILLRLMHVRGAALPEKRTQLYDAYVDFFFAREAEKNETVKKFRDLLIDIHRFLAWVLHVQAESGGEGRISSDELKRVLTDYLEHEQRSTAIVSEVFEAMLDRVVMLVSRLENTYEFEVQPLREYFAARFLYDTAPYSPTGRERSGTKPDRFDAVARSPYWLNVARFFSGCFSKGELLDLSYRVRLLLSDAKYGATAYPARLAAMLLGDWVFQQSSPALHDVVGDLCFDRQLPKILPQHVGMPNQDEFIFPEDCGRQGLLSRVRELLRSDSLGSDWTVRLVSFLILNAAPSENLKWWERLVRANEFPSAARALWIGRFLSNYRRSSRLLSLGAALSYNELDDFAIIHLMTGPFDADLLRDRRVQDRALQIMLDDPSFYGLGGRSSIGPLFLVPAFLDSWAFPFQSIYGRESWMNQASSFRELEPAADVEALSPASRSCFAFSKRAVNELQRNATIGVTAMSERVLDIGLDIWGVRPRFFLAAITMASEGTDVQGPTGQPRKFESKFVESIGRARANAKDAAFWIGEWTRAANEDDRKILFHLMFWSLATPVLFGDPQFAAIVDDVERISTDAWSGLAQTAWMMGLMSRYGPSRTMRKERVHVLKGRAAVLRALRDPAYSLQINLHEFTCDGTGGLRSTLVSAKIYATLAQAVQQKISWRDALEVVREAYTREGVLQHGTALNDKIALPVDAAMDVLSSPWSYPTELWDFALSSLTAKVLSDGGHVSDAAREGAWFDAPRLYGI